MRRRRRSTTNVAAMAGQPAPAGPAQSLVTSLTVGPDRNNFTGEVGVRLGIGAAPVTVSWMGYRCGTGNSGLRTVSIYEWFADALQRRATIDLVGKTVGQWAWAAIAPLVLAANGYYGLLSNVTDSDGQQWLENTPVTMQPSIVNIYATYRSPGGAMAVTGINMTFIGLDLGWSP